MSNNNDSFITASSENEEDSIMESSIDRSDAVKGSPKRGKKGLRVLSSSEEDEDEDFNCTRNGNYKEKSYTKMEDRNSRKNEEVQNSSTSKFLERQSYNMSSSEGEEDSIMESSIDGSDAEVDDNLPVKESPKRGKKGLKVLSSSEEVEDGDFNCTRNGNYKEKSYTKMEDRKSGRNEELQNSSTSKFLERQSCNMSSSKNEEDSIIESSMVETTVNKDNSSKTKDEVSSSLKRGKGMNVSNSSKEDDKNHSYTRKSNYSNQPYKITENRKSEVKMNKENMKVMNTSEYGDTSRGNKEQFTEKGNVQNSPTSKFLGRQPYRESLAIIHSRSPSPESEDDLNIIDSSSDDERNFFPTHQSTIADLENMDPNVQIIEVSDSTNIEVVSDTPDSRTSTSSSKLQVTNVEYDKQVNILQNLRSNEVLAKKTIQSVNLSALPDKGLALLRKHESLLENIKEQEKKLSNMIISHTIPKERCWKDVEAQLNTVQPKTFGKKALQTLNVQKALTMDRLEQIHSSLNNCPQKDAVVETPKGLKVELMPHQKYALAWLLWRKAQKPSGGILADDMGLGKTLTMIAFTLHDLQTENDNDSEDSDDESNKDRKNYKYPGGILVVCPASLIYQWSAEITKHIKRGLLSVENYHGANRENRAKRLAKHDFVITTYTLAKNDHVKNGPLFNIKWQHIILDEAHQIRNPKSQMSVAVCNLSGKSRWALTGTPIHNKELDIYALLKFLRCSPFDDIAVWKRWVSDKTTGGQDRLNMVMSSLILRRTKQQLSEKNLLPSLPEKTWKLLEINLNKQELNVYQKVLIFSRTLFAQFLHQRAERDTDNMPQALTNPNDEYYKMHKKLVKMNRVKKIKQHEILVLLLRLRQICCHPSLITGMLGNDDNIQDIDGADDDFEDMNLLDQLNKLNIDDEHDENNRMSIGGVEVGLAEASKGILNPSNPVFSHNYCSSKINNIVKLLADILPTGDKVIIVSQWTSFLHLVGAHLKENGVQFYVLNGTVPVSKRMEIVDGINNTSHKVQVLLLSLTAGGVGLNLVGANHLVLADLHWNPQLEMQAQDRIFRLGQTKPVMVYKLLTSNTIEQRIKNLQDNKLSIANQVLTGAKIQHHNKLSLDDLKMLFNM